MHQQITGGRVCRGRVCRGRVCREVTLWGGNFVRDEFVRGRVCIDSWRVCQRGQDCKGRVCQGASWLASVHVHVCTMRLYTYTSLAYLSECGYTHQPAQWHLSSCGYSRQLYPRCYLQLRAMYLFSQNMHDLGLRTCTLCIWLYY